MKYRHYRYLSTTVATALIGLVVLPAVAMDAADFLKMTNQQAELEAGGSARQPQQEAQRDVIVLPPAAAPAEPPLNGVKNEDADITEARLGIMTPYGKRALVQEMRNYYPASYRAFRALNPEQVDELVALYTSNTDLGAVLARMDKMPLN